MKTISNQPTNNKQYPTSNFLTNSVPRKGCIQDKSESFNTYRNKSPIRKAIEDWIADIDTKYVLTVTFTYGTSERQIKNLLKMFIKNFNHKFYRTHYNRGEFFQEGVLAIEKTHAMETGHFHILLFDHEHIPSLDKIKEWSVNQKKLFRKQNNRYCIHTIDCQNYWNFGEDRCEQYINKNEDVMDQGSYLESLSPLDAYGVCFGEDILNLAKYNCHGFYKPKSYQERTVGAFKTKLDY